MCSCPWATGAPDDSPHPTEAMSCRGRQATVLTRTGEAVGVFCMIKYDQGGWAANQGYRGFGPRLPIQDRCVKCSTCCNTAADSPPDGVRQAMSCRFSTSGGVSVWFCWSVTCAPSSGFPFPNRLRDMINAPIRVRAMPADAPRQSTAGRLAAVSLAKRNWHGRESSE